MAKQVKRILLHNHLAPGDAVAMTACVRDLHINHPRQFVTDVRTTAQSIWEYNPYLTDIKDDDKRIVNLDVDQPSDLRYDESMEYAAHLHDRVKEAWEADKIPAVRMDYPGVHRSDEASCHFTEAYTDYLEVLLGVRIRKRQTNGCIFIGEEERGWISQVHELTHRDTHYWIVVNGGKMDFTCKWWDPARMQRVVSHFKKLTFVQVGEVNKSHIHVPLLGDNVINLMGKTDMRQLIRLVYHSSGCICPVTMLMHLAAAVPVRHEKVYGRSSRPCIVLAGGRESPRWEGYATHAYLHTVGMLDCCSHGGCWKSRVIKVGDGDQADSNLCRYPEVSENGVIMPRCMKRLTLDAVVATIENYLP